MSKPMSRLGPINRKNGAAGRFSLSVQVTYPGEAAATVTFVGFSSGGPVVMVTPGSQSFVIDPERFGTFGPGWVLRFFGLGDSDL